MNEFIYSLSEAGLLNVTIFDEDLITTTSLKLLLGKNIEKKFGYNQPCSITVSPSGDAPAFTKNFDFYTLETNINMDFKCLDNTTGLYLQAVTLQIALDMDVDFNIAY